MNRVPEFNIYSLENKKEINLSIFSRIIPGKLIHTVVQTIALLDAKYKLKIYGFEDPMTEYQKDLINMITRLNLQKRISCEPMLDTNSARITAIKNTDICINLSTTFEETLGKTILEVCYWGKKVIANEWSGFIDILPKNQIINTHWNPRDWYNVRSNELREKLEQVREVNELENHGLYQRFFEQIRSHDLKYQKNEIRENVKEKTLGDANKINFKDRRKMRETVEKIFAPSLEKEYELGLPHTQHPLTILVLNEYIETKGQIIEKINRWKFYNRDSIYRSEANRLLEMLENKEDNNA